MDSLRFNLSRSLSEEGIANLPQTEKLKWRFDRTSQDLIMQYDGKNIGIYDCSFMNSEDYHTRIYWMAYLIGGAFLSGLKEGEGINGDT